MKFLSTLLILITISVQAKEVKLLTVDESLSPYFQISKVTTSSYLLDKESAEYEALIPNAANLKSFSDLQQASMIIDGLIAIGKKIWPIIEAGKPVVNISSSEAVSVIPNKSEDIDMLWDMEGWSTPVAKRYNVVYQNSYGIEVVKIQYTLIYQYGGSFDGVGKFLLGVKMIPQVVEVAWGFTLDAATEVVSISNHGTKSAPVAGLTIAMKYNVSTVFKTINQMDTFHIQGDGKFSKL